MIRVQYFARYREALGIDGEQLNWDAGLATLGACASSWWSAAGPGSVPSASRT